METAQISIIIPVRNEAQEIAAILQRIKRTSNLLPTEIIIVDGNSQDQTIETAQLFADQVIQAPRSGRGFQMHLGAQKASGAIFVFLHADTELPQNWQQVIARSFLENKNPPAAAAFKLGFSQNNWKLNLIALLAHWRLQFTQVPHGDQALIVRKETYFRSGGFPDVALMEEYYLLAALKKLGKIKIYPEAVQTSARKYLIRGPFKNAIKNSILLGLFHLGVPPKKLAQWY